MYIQKFPLLDIELKTFEHCQKLLQENDNM